MGGRHRAGGGGRRARRPLRTGLVIGRDAMLVKILGLVFKLGLGGRMGSGRQYWPWIGLRDEVDAIRFLLTPRPARST